MNLSRFPTIVCCKTIILEFPFQNLRSQTFFNFDAEIDKSILKGIRIEYAGNSTQIPATAVPPKSMDYQASNFFSYSGGSQFVCAPFICGYFGITLVDKKNNNVLQNYPLNGLNNPNEITPNTNYIRRFNTEIDFSKSYISLLDKTITIIGQPYYYFSLTFYYKPKN